jgi:hypothetical protein
MPTPLLTTKLYIPPVALAALGVYKFVRKDK